MCGQARRSIARAVLYQLTADAATSLAFTLAAANTTADVDLWIADTAGVVMRQFQSDGAADETGAIDLIAAQDVLLVVVGAGVDTGYSLALDAMTP